MLAHTCNPTAQETETGGAKVHVVPGHTARFIKKKKNQKTVTRIQPKSLKRLTAEES